MDPRVGPVIEVLKSVRRRPAMYLGSVDAAAAETFLNGFRVGCSACGLDVPLDVRERATHARGWPWDARSPADAMRERGLGEAAVVEELLALEADAWELWRGGPA